MASASGDDGSRAAPAAPRPGPAYDVGVVGLGYVGLTLATALADLGLTVLGVERRADIVAMTNAGRPHFTEVGLDYTLASVVRKGLLTAAERFGPDATCRTYIITVGTPLGPNGKARLDFIRHATQEVADVMPAGALVMLRSTVKIGTTRHVVEPILARRGAPYQLAMCPERTLEGKAMEELSRLPQIVGADSPEAREAAARFFHKLTPTIVQLPQYEAAEIIKLVDNTYRDVQFGFANEVARVCERFGVSAMDVIEGGKLGYPRTDLAIPGLVGGPCLEKDPHIFCESVGDAGLDLEITRAARLVNERQPVETVDTALAIFQAKYGRLPARATLLGVAFKGVPETGDLRGTMARPVFEHLRRRAPHCAVAVFDPAAAAEDVRAVFPGVAIAETMEAALTDAELLFITNNHPAFARMRVGELREAMAPAALIYDYWNHFARTKTEDRGDCYVSVGGVNGADELLARERVDAPL